MNPIDKILLWLFMLPKGLYSKLNVNTTQLRAILSAKLTMDNRRPSGFMQMNRRNAKKEFSKSSLVTFFSSLLMGLFFMFSFVAGHDIVTKLTLFFSMYITMIAMTLITDFTSVLIDVRDNLIILPKPVNDATFVTARLLHICIRTCMIMIPLSFPSAICVVAISGIGTLLPYLLMVVMSTLLGIFIINALYIFILKVTTPARFQGIISYIQIVFTVVIYASYQVLPRMMSRMNVMEANVNSFTFIPYYPPYWFARASDVLSGNGVDPSGALNVGLAILLPLFSIWLVVRYFAPSFNRKLSMITASVDEKASRMEKQDVMKRKPLVERLGRILTRPGSEYMGFYFAWKMMSRSRDFRMKVFPSIGYMIVLLAMLIYNNSFNVSDGLGSESFFLRIFIMAIYFSSVLVMAAINHLPYTDRHKAAWIFDVSPIDQPGKVISGGVKSAISFFFLPIIILLLPAGLYFLGPKFLLHILFGGINILAICSLNAYVVMRDLPFSIPMPENTRGNSFIRSMLMLVLPVLLGIFHWFISGFTPLIIILTLVMAAVPWLVFDGIRKMGWEKISD